MAGEKQLKHRQRAVGDKTLTGIKTSNKYQTRDADNGKSFYVNFIRVPSRNLFK